MIDSNAAVEAIKEKLAKMTCAEREEYLRRMGFSFDETSNRKNNRAARNGRRSMVGKVSGAKPVGHALSVTFSALAKSRD